MSFPKGEDENIVDLEAMAKLEKDLVDAKAWNERIAWKKQEWADCLKKKKEDKEVVEAQQKVDKATKRKVLVSPPVSVVYLPSSVGN